MAAVHDCCFELVDHPPYSPDFAPSDYFLFPNMKKNNCPGDSELPSSVFQAIHKMSLVLRFTVLNYIVHVLQWGFIWKQTMQLVSGKVELMHSKFISLPMNCSAHSCKELVYNM